MLLYKNAFHLRRRIPDTDGFPSGEPEIVFKFRHPDIQKAAETDVRPEIVGDYRVKFKCQALPLKTRPRGIRPPFRTTCSSPAHILAPTTHSNLMRHKHFPGADCREHSPQEEIALVNNTIIEEVLQDIGSLDFGSGLKAKTNVAIWRTRGEHGR